SSIRELAQRTGLSEDELRALAESGACDCFRLRRRELLWQLGLVPRPASVPGTAGEAKQLALPLQPTVATPEPPQPTACERLLVRGRYEHSDRNRNVLVDELVSLAPLARSLTDGADVHAALPRAHHFGHR